MIFALAISMSGCAAKRQHATVPGCGAPVFVPAGCYSMPFPDRVEVRCPGRTWKFHCTEEHK